MYVHSVSDTRQPVRISGLLLPANRRGLEKRPLRASTLSFVCTVQAANYNFQSLSYSRKRGLRCS